MISLNGKIQEDSNLSLEKNRGFLYADALFDTLVYRNNKIEFLDLHYFRLLAGIRELRMEIPSFFTQDYWEHQILKTIESNRLNDARVRTTVFRDTTGLYTPNKPKISFIITADKLITTTKEKYTLGIYKDNFTNNSSINNIKTTNRIINVLASVYAKENNFDTCLLLNHKKQIAETIHANIFLVFKNLIKTPALSEGCVKGIIREKLIALLNKTNEFILIETEINPFDLKNADEVFITNSVISIQAITQFKNKKYVSDVSKRLTKMLKDSLI